jgi:transposase
MAKTLAITNFSKAELIKLVLEQRAEIDRLKVELENLKRKQARQAAPFSRNQPKKNPKRSGRKPGVGNFKYRTAPTPESVTNTIIVPAPECCPDCKVTLEQHKTSLAFITDLPIITPTVTQFEVGEGTCPKCKRQFRGVHPELASNQVGATAHRLGTRALAVGHALQYDFGITARKVPQVLKDVLNFNVTHSAFTQQALKRGNLETGVIGLEYQKLREQIKTSNVVNTDDTSWQTGGKASYLMGFKTNTAVVYQVRDQHRALEVLEVIPKDYAGVLVTDRFVTYDAKVFNEVKQQKCVAHILKNLKQLLEKPVRGRSQAFPKALRKVFKDALKVHSSFTINAITRAVFDKAAKSILRRLDRLLESAGLSNKDNLRLQRELAWHHARGSLLRFLLEPEVSPTNNAAERVLRSGVVVRKLSAGSKNEAGAAAFSGFKSVIETGKLSGRSGLKTLLDLYAR